MAKRRITSISKKRGDAIKVVIKDNQLVEAKYMFNIWETRFFLTLITMINKEDEEDKVYRIWFKDIKKNFKINSNKSYDLLREAAISLSNKSVNIPSLDQGYKRNAKRRLLQFVDYLEKGQTGEDIGKQEYIDVAIDKEIQPFLLHVKKNFDPKITRYTKYELVNAENLKPYAIRIYELMKQFEHRGYRTIRVEDLKEMFLIENEYPRFSTFNQSVILPSIKAINKHTDITVPIDRIEKIKKGRKVDSLRFTILTKTKTQIAKMRNVPGTQSTLFDDEGTTEQDFTEVDVVEEIEALTPTDLLFTEYEDIVVKTFGVTPSVFIKVLNSGAYKKENIEQAISVTRRAKFNQEITKSVAGFFLRALKEGYTDLKEEQKKKAIGERLKQEAKAKINKQILDLKAERKSETNKIIKKLTAANPELTQRAIQTLGEIAMAKIVITNKEIQLGRALEIEDYRHDTMLRELVKNQIVELEKDEFRDAFLLIDEKISLLEQQFKKV